MLCISFDRKSKYIKNKMEYYIFQVFHYKWRWHSNGRLLWEEWQWGVRYWSVCYAVSPGVYVWHREREHPSNWHSRYWGQSWQWPGQRKLFEHLGLPDPLRQDQRRCCASQAKQCKVNSDLQVLCVGVADPPSQVPCVKHNIRLHELKINYVQTWGHSCSS